MTKVVDGQHQDTVASSDGEQGGADTDLSLVSTDRPSRYHKATQHDGRGWMILRLDEFGTGFPAPARVVACNLSEADALAQLADLRSAEVLDPDYPIEQVNADLRAAGGDPDAIGKRGAALVEELLSKRNEQAS